MRTILAISSESCNIGIGVCRPIGLVGCLRTEDTPQAPEE